MASEPSSSTRTILLVHGMYMNAASWQPWVERASGRGYQCHAVSWPHHEGDPARLREIIDKDLGSLTFGQPGVGRSS